MARIINALITKAISNSAHRNFFACRNIDVTDFSFIRPLGAENVSQFGSALNAHLCGMIFQTSRNIAHRSIVPSLSLLVSLFPKARLSVIKSFVKGKKKGTGGASRFIFIAGNPEVGLFLFADLFVCLCVIVNCRRGVVSRESAFG